MAKKHVMNYYYTVQNQYLKMKSMLDLFEKQVKEGKGSLETLDAVKETTGRLKENFDRIAYIMYLLNTPAKKKKSNRYDKQNKELKDYLETSDLNHIKDENENVLVQLSEMIKEKKDDSEGIKWWTWNR